MSDSVAGEGLRIAWKSDVGTQREGNEDVVVCEPELGLFAVIDGVGGEVAGERGAAEAAEILRRRLRREEGSTERQVREAVALANNRLYELSEDDPSLRGMSCVLTVALLRAQEIVVGHVGDTRLYLIDQDGMQKVTSDHSPVGQMEELGELSEAEAMRHPRRNEIFRDVGSAWREPDDADFLEIYRRDFPGQVAMLICSDGLTDQVGTAKILEVVRRCAGHPGVAVDELVRLANEAGGKDNVSLVLVEGEDFAAEVLYSERGADELGDTRRLQTGDAHAARQAGSEGARLAVAGASVGDPGPPAPRRSAAAATHGPRGSGDRPAALRGAAAARTSRIRTVAGVAALAALLLLGWLLLGKPGAPPAVERAADRVTRRIGLGPAWTLEVGPGRGYETIGAALADALGGDTVLVDDGTYRERLELRSGVSVRARNPRAVVLETAAESSADDGAAVLAERVRNARLEGISIAVSGEAASGAAGSDAGLPVALRLIDARVELSDLEISGSTDAAIEALGADDSIIVRSYLRDHRGACVRIAPRATTEVLENLFVRCGQDGSQPAIDAREAIGAVVRGNDFRDNRVALWAGLRPLEELQLVNDFDLDPDQQVVSGPPLREPTPPATDGAATGAGAGGGGGSGGGSD